MNKWNFRLVITLIYIAVSIAIGTNEVTVWHRIVGLVYIIVTTIHSIKANE